MVLLGVDRGPHSAVSAAAMVFIAAYPLSEEAKMCSQDSGRYRIIFDSYNLLYVLLERTF